MRTRSASLTSSLPSAQALSEATPESEGLVQRPISDSSLGPAMSHFQAEIQAEIARREEIMHGQAGPVLLGSGAPPAAADDSDATAPMLLEPPVTMPGSPAPSVSSSSASTEDMLQFSLNGILQSVLCPVCFLPPLSPHALVTPCGHTFCSSCILQWTKMSARSSCPTCRKPIPNPTKTLTRNVMIESLLHSLGVKPVEGETLETPPPPRPVPSITRVRAATQRQEPAALLNVQHNERHSAVLAGIRAVSRGEEIPEPESGRNAMLNEIRRSRRLRIVNWSIRLGDRRHGQTGGGGRQPEVAPGSTLMGSNYDTRNPNSYPNDTRQRLASRNPPASPPPHIGRAASSGRTRRASEANLQGEGGDNDLLSAIRQGAALRRVPPRGAPPAPPVVGPINTLLDAIRNGGGMRRSSSGGIYPPFYAGT